MSHTLYASFDRPEDAEKAAGELLDAGVRAEDLSVVRPHGEGLTSETAPTTTASNVLLDPADRTAARTDVANGDTIEDADAVERGDVDAEAAAGAWKGATIGAGIGAVAALAALLIPGFGLVMGAGALASALGGVAASAGVGAAAGAIRAYMKDAGVDDETADQYEEVVEGGGAVLAVTVPSGTVEEERANAILKRYGATNVNRYAARGYVA